MGLWVDRWIPSLPLGHPFPRCKVAVSINTQVKSLICQNTITWDIDFLRAFLSVEEQNEILDTFVKDISKRDRLVWPFNKRVRYTVKSRYHWAHLRSSILVD